MLTIILLFYLSFLLYLRSRKSYWNRQGINEIKGYPIVGNLLPLLLKRKTYYHMMEELYKVGEGKKYVGIYPGPQPTLLVRDPGLIEVILKENARNFEDRGMYADFSDPLSLNLFFLKGKLWKWIRSKMASAFSDDRLKMAIRGMEICTEDCLETLGLGVNIKNEMDQFTWNVFSRTVFILDDSAGLIECTKKIFDLSGLKGIGVFLRIFLPHFARAVGIRIASKEIETFYRNAITNSTRVPGSFLDYMLHLNEVEPNFSEDIMTAQFFIFVLAGFETTSSTLTYALYLLSKNPEIQEKARYEVAAVFKEHGMSYDSLKKLNYLDFIINETLRLYPPLTGMNRVTEKPFILPCGSVLPAGVPINIQIYAMHRDPAYYEDPLNFKPERWEKTHQVFYPFGLGPRICIGKKFALLEMKIFLSIILMKYNIKLNDATVEPFEFDPTSLLIKTKTSILLDFVKLF